MNKNSKIIGAIVLAVVVVGALIFLITKPKSSNLVGVTPGEKAKVTEDMLANQTPEAAKETEKLLNEVIGDKGTSTTKTISVMVPPTNGATTTTVREVKVMTINPGTSPVDMTSGKVLTELGQTANNSAKPSSPQAPSESFPMDIKEAPASAIKLNVTSSSFAPNSFTVNRGQVVSLVVTNVNETTFSEIFRFDDPSLGGVVIGLAKGETKSITFNAPAKAGEYAFYSSMFDHRAQGAVGKMIVK
ncbi:MAG: cupredoxin domain-containing protein [Patescibacteria group bacterium]